MWRAIAATFLSRSSLVVCTAAGFFAGSTYDVLAPRAGLSRGTVDTLIAGLVGGLVMFAVEVRAELKRVPKK